MDQIPRMTPEWHPGMDGRAYWARLHREKDEDMHLLHEEAAYHSAELKATFRNSAWRDAAETWSRGHVEDQWAEVAEAIRLAGPLF